MTAVYISYQCLGQLLCQKDGAGGGTAIFFGMMLAGLFYFLAHMNFHLLATKITDRTDPSKTTRVWAHVAAILTALATLAGAGYLEYLSLVG